MDDGSTQGGWMGCWVIHDGVGGGGETSWPFGFLQRLQLYDRKYRIGIKDLTGHHHTIHHLDPTSPYPPSKNLFNPSISQISFPDRSCNPIVNNPFKSPSLHTRHKKPTPALHHQSAAPLWANAMRCPFLPPYLPLYTHPQTPVSVRSPLR